MRTESDHAREIAERIARRVSGDTPSQTSRAQSVSGVNSAPELTSELADVRAGLSELQRKIAQLEAKMGSQSAHAPVNSGLSNSTPPPARSTYRVPLTHSPWLAGVNAGAAHPSQERFGVEEAVVSELVDYFEKEKICSVEPGGQPCDHCTMCNTRGF